MIDIIYMVGIWQCHIPTPNHHVIFPPGGNMTGGNVLVSHRHHRHHVGDIFLPCFDCPHHHYQSFWTTTLGLIVIIAVLVWPDVQYKLMWWRSPTAPEIWDWVIFSVTDILGWSLPFSLHFFSQSLHLIIIFSNTSSSSNASSWQLIKTVNCNFELI